MCLASQYLCQNLNGTIFPRSLDPFYVLTYYTKLWQYSMYLICIDLGGPSSRTS